MTPRSTRSGSTHAALVSAAFLATTLALVGCGSAVDGGGGAGGTNSDGTDGTLSVLTSFYPLQFLAEQIGGEHASVTDLTPRGGEPHELELAPATIRMVQKADVVLYLAGFQPAVDQALDASGDTPRFDVAPAANLLELASADHGDGDDDSGDGHTHDDGHDHGPLDPHFWLDPVRFAAVAEQVGAEFAQIDPAHAPEYAARTEALLVSLQELDTEFSRGLATCESRTIVTSHSAFGYLSTRYDLTQTAISGLDPESEPSPGRLRRVSEQVVRDGVTTIFYESSSSAKVAQVLAKDLGISAAVLDPLETLQPREQHTEADNVPEPDYLTVMAQNLTTLRTALTCN